MLFTIEHSGRGRLYTMARHRGGKRLADQQPKRPRQEVSDLHDRLHEAATLPTVSLL
jgi:hypothetical protein